MLGVGDVRVASDGMAEFRIRNTQLLLQHIIPLFDRYRLLTSKYYNYDLFKQALLIVTDSTIPTAQKHAMLAVHKSKVRPNDYVSPV
jgi:hypothetical protein